MIYRDQVGLLNLSLKCHVWDKLLFNSAIGSCHCSEIARQIRCSSCLLV